MTEPTNDQRALSILTAFDHDEMTDSELLTLTGQDDILGVIRAMSSICLGMMDIVTDHDAPKMIQHLALHTRGITAA